MAGPRSARFRHHVLAVARESDWDHTARVTLTEFDLALVDALQARPRGSWASIGAALGVSGSTAARRWERLRSGGLAWLTTYAAFGATMIGYVEVDCHPAEVAATANRLAALGWVVSVEHVAGSCDLLLVVSTADLATLSAAATDDIGTLAGVTGVRVRLATRLYGEGSDWQAGSLEPGQRSRLTDTSSHAAAAAAGLSLADLPLLEVLGEDGRASYASVADRLGIAEHVARRRIQRLTEAGRVVFRCDFAHELAGWPVTAALRAWVPPSRLDEIGAALRALPEFRLCAAVTGDANLFATVWLHSVGAEQRLETTLGQRFPELRVVDRAVTMRAVKRMGRLLDECGRATGYVPFATRLATADAPGRSRPASTPR